MNKTCNCSPKCDKCACPCHTTSEPYFEIKTLVSGDTNIQLKPSIKMLAN